MIGTVDSHMAVQTGPVKSPVIKDAISGLTGIGTAARGQFAGVAHIGVAALTQVWAPGL